MLQASMAQQVDPRRNYVGPSIARLSSALPEDARAIIERVSRPGRDPEWRLRFDRRSRYGVDPLTGWTSGCDPLSHVMLRFPDLASAIRYAERHDLPYEVRDEAVEKRRFGGRNEWVEQAPLELSRWPPDTNGSG